MSTKRFAFTLRYNPKQEFYSHSAIEGLYIDVFNSWIYKYNCDVPVKIPEYKEGNYHYHGIIVVPKSLLRKKLCPDMFHLKLNELHNEEGWMEYIKKSAHIHPIELRDDHLFSLNIRKRLFPLREI